MSVIFTNESRMRSYDINYVKDVYTAKKASGTTVISAVEKAEDAPVDSYVVSRAKGRSQNYYEDFAADYLEGRITEEEFYSHMEDLFYGYGMYHEDATQGQKQYYFEEVTQLAYNGILEFYMMKNAAEWKANAGDAQFYFNSDYHYQHLEQLPALLDGVDKLANKLGVEANLGRYNQNILTVNGRMATMLNTKCGSIGTLDEVPPPGIKIILHTNYEPYTAEVECEGKKYFTGIPFSYDTYTYKFGLADLFEGFDIPEKYMSYFKNISVINEAVAMLYSAKGGGRTHQISSDIFSGIKNYDSIVKRVIDKYDANATEKVVFANLFEINEYRKAEGNE